MTTSSTESMNLWYLWTATAATVSTRSMISMTLLPNIYKITTTLLWNPYDIYSSMVSTRYLQLCYRISMELLWCLQLLWQLWYLQGFPGFADVFNCIIIQLQVCWKIMPAWGLMSAMEWTAFSTTIFSMMANTSINFYQSYSICSGT